MASQRVGWQEGFSTFCWAAVWRETTPQDESECVRSHAQVSCRPSIRLQAQCGPRLRQLETRTWKVLSAFDFDKAERPAVGLCLIVWRWEVWGQINLRTADCSTCAVLLL